MLNKTIKGKNNKTYTVTNRLIKEDRDNSNIYVCRDEDGIIYLMKHFYKLSPASFVGWSKYNHYGRRRDGSEIVFSEIQQLNDKHPFLLKHIERIKFENKWLIILEYVDGVTFHKYLVDNLLSNPTAVLNASKQLGFVLKEWHLNKLAHGDAHLDNVMVKTKINGEIEIRLIDYGLLHHPDFYCCKKFNCFNEGKQYTRYQEDLRNSSSKLGKGFLNEIKALEKNFNTAIPLSEAFCDGYKSA